MRATRALVALIREVFPRYAFGFLYRYRVVDMVGTRCRLQAVSDSLGLPHLMHVSVLPGVAGAAAVLTPGTVVLVAFIEGDPAQPVVTHFAAEDAAGWVPVSLAFDATTTITLGSILPLPVARMTDPVQCGPFSGTIVSGSTKVRAS